MNVKFYKNTENGEVTLSLLGREPAENEKELKANATDAAVEKHVPVVSIEGNKVHAIVGSALHPMTEAHYITFICMVTDQKAELKKLKPEEKPEAEFVLADGEKLLAVYAYCNLHGLWVKEEK